MNQQKISFLAVLSSMVIVFFTNSNGQNVAKDPNEPNLRQVGARLPTLDTEFKTALATGDLSRVRDLQAELGTLLFTTVMTSEQHKRVADMVIEYRLAGMLPVLAGNLNRSIWPGSSMRAYTTQYPLTRALVAFGQHSLSPVKKQLLSSNKWYEVEVLAYCLLGIQGAEHARDSLQELQKQVSDIELRGLLQRAEDWIIRHNRLFMVDFGEDRIPQIPEDEMIFVELPDQANAVQDESSPNRTPAVSPGNDGRMETPVQKRTLVDRSQDLGTPASSAPWSFVVVLIFAATGLLWVLLKKRK